MINNFLKFNNLENEKNLILLLGKIFHNLHTKITLTFF